MQLHVQSEADYGGGPGSLKGAVNLSLAGKVLLESVGLHEVQGYDCRPRPASFPVRRTVHAANMASNLPGWPDFVVSLSAAGGTANSFGFHNPPLAMKTLPILLSAFASVFLLGAAEEKPAPKAVPPDKAKAEAEPFIIFHITDKHPIRLIDEYGVMLINTGWEENPSPRFLIAMMKGRTLIDTTDPRIAAQALKLIPKGRNVRWYDSCTVPRSYGLPEAVRDNLEAAIKSAGLKLLEDPDITCYCPE